MWSWHKKDNNQRSRWGLFLDFGYCIIVYYNGYHKAPLILGLWVWLCLSIFYEFSLVLMDYLTSAKEGIWLFMPHLTHHTALTFLRRHLSIWHSYLTQNLKALPTQSGRPALAEASWLQILSIMQARWCPGKLW